MKHNGYKPLQELSFKESDRILGAHRTQQQQATLQLLQIMR